MTTRSLRASSAIAATALLTGLLAVPLAAPASTASAAAAVAPTASVSTRTVNGLLIENSFVSAVGWVKPGDTYPSRILVTNTNATPSAPNVTIQVQAPTGSTLLAATGPGSKTAVPGTSLTWTPGSIAAGATATLVLTSQAKSITELGTIVWRDLSTRATLTSGTSTGMVTSHGPKVIPPGGAYDTARYGDRPFPVVPVQYQERAYAANHTGGDLEQVINDPAKPGSTFNLYQEMSLGQLFPEADVPSAGIASASFTGTDSNGQPYSGTDFTFTRITDAMTGAQPGPGSPVPTCTGLTFGDSPVEPGTNPLYTSRITNGVYNLPGTTGYYGQDGSGSAIIGSLVGIGQFMQLDNACGPTSKIVYDAAVIADPEIDYSDFDTDKDGVVDFFMAVFAGCGGNGSSQLSTALTPCSDNPTDLLPYDNVWPHSADLRYYYKDPVTGLPGYTTKDQLKNLEGKPLWYVDSKRRSMTTENTGDALKVFVRIGPYNLNPETAIDKASVISHEYGHSLGLPDFYSIDPDGRETYGDWNLMATDKSQNMDAYSRQELGWVVPEVLKASTSVTGMTDSKHDTGTIHWRTPNGAQYTLTNGVDGVVHNSKMYVAKLPGVSLLDPAAFETGDKASATHAWFSGAGNDFGCASDGQGHNLDLAVPGLTDLPVGTSVKLDFKSMFDIEWDYDYGFVLTSKDAGTTWASHASLRDVPTTTASNNPNTNACQDTYGNGITGSSSSYTDQLTVTQDRLLGTYPEKSFIADSFDISDLAGAEAPVLRFSYSTDPGLAKAGWFIDDLLVTATLPTGEQVLLDTNLESDGGPDDPRFFSGSCKGSLSVTQSCTPGWQFVAAGAGAPQDHGYYLELRDRSGFDIDGHGQIDRDPIGFVPGFYAAYTDESRGYGNVGVTGIPAQSPLDANPEPGNITPDLNNAAYLPGTGTDPNGPNAFSDAFASPHVDNYVDDAENNWTLSYNCLGFKVNALNEGANPDPTNASPVSTLTGDVAFTIGNNCAAFSYNYDPNVPVPNTPPVAIATAQPRWVKFGKPVTFNAAGSHDAETPNEGLNFVWDFDGDGTKDATGVTVQHAFPTVGTYNVKMTVSDFNGLTDSAIVPVKVTKGDQSPEPVIRVSKPKPMIRERIAFSAVGTTDADTLQEDLTYKWNFNNGGAAVDATGQRITTAFARAGLHTVSLTVTDLDGNSATESKTITVRREIVCNSAAVARTGSWRTVRSSTATGGSYCDNLGTRTGRDTMTLKFSGPELDLFYGVSSTGGWGKILIDGRHVANVSFRGAGKVPSVVKHKIISGLSTGRHTVRLIVMKGRAYVDGFIVTR